MTYSPATEDEWVCRVCRRPLDSHERHDADGTLIAHRWQHTLIDVARGIDHDPDPVRLSDTGGEIVGTCDFCSAPHPTWVYPCTTFTLGTYGSVGDWGACDTCHRLIDTGQWARLTDRAVAHQPKAIRSQARRWVGTLHRAFRQHQTGDPHPLGRHPL